MQLSNYLIFVKTFSIQPRLVCSCAVRMIRIEIFVGINMFLDMM